MHIHVVGLFVLLITTMNRMVEGLSKPNHVVDVGSNIQKTKMLQQQAAAAAAALPRVDSTILQQRGGAYRQRHEEGLISEQTTLMSTMTIFVTLMGTIMVLSKIHGVEYL